MKPPPPPNGFWSDALALAGSATGRVAGSVVAFGLMATAVLLVARVVEAQSELQIGVEVAPYELAGAALGLLLVLRTNAGYDRWWEARKLWGGIVNQCRNLVVSGLTYGPPDPDWRRRFVGWVAAFPHAARTTLQGVPPPAEVAALVGADDAERLAKSVHPPSAVARELAELLKGAPGMDRFAFLQVDRERALLIDHVGACERIRNTPLPRAYAITTRQFLLVFLGLLPFALLHRLEADGLVPLITMMVAYPLLALDRIGDELQNPFDPARLSHLPLADIAAGIERVALGLLAEER